MVPLLDAVTELVALVSPLKIEAIASRLQGMFPADRTQSLQQIVGTPPARTALKALTTAWSNTTLPGDVLAGMLLSAAHTRARMQRDCSVEFAWTGPTTPFVATRRTEQVLLDLIQQAEQELFIVSFVTYDIPSITAAINAAIDRGVVTRILVEASSNQGGSLHVDPVSVMKNSVPHAELFIWTDRPAPFTNGKVHAKLAVADDASAFLTSANLTGHALEKNMEAGVLITGGHIPLSLRAHLLALIDTKIIRPP